MVILEGAVELGGEFEVGHPVAQPGAKIRIGALGTVIGLFPHGRANEGQPLGFEGAQLV